MRKNGVIGIAIGVMLTFCSSNASAEKGWITQAKITKVVGVFNGGVNIRITPELTGCTSQSGYGASYASLYPDHEGKDQILSILLAAYMADKTVAIYLSDDTCKIYEVELGGR
ncbi:hypothetical protein F0267_23165 [Vibrio coralliilyticus]|uniref:Uncharacterized protein n=1 Tax=Vibrio coralliilyticus TaxID=190893 RepID=A0AAN0SAN0_9VIBR|nr:hypothetical protein [Vibrio coralliilyticus]AIW18804.1 hypothetical protein IX92_06985 [Vibrio coralliilyticus]NOH41131.1 hypothetical protein [Vibrio coralliilyticus]